MRADTDRLLGVIELTCGVPADSSQILAGAASAVAVAEPGRALYLLSLASWGAAFARDRRRGRGHRAQRRAPARSRTRLPRASCARGWPACGPFHARLRCRRRVLSHLALAVDVRPTTVSPIGSASSARSGSSCATTAPCSSCIAA